MICQLDLFLSTFPHSRLDMGDGASDQSALSGPLCIAVIRVGRGAAVATGRAIGV